ncbi:hypothetical protein L2750_12285 [Shewanella submarina]|uniref:Uncharacterized protein n=1 Tax=Shewanella submarina TaxID=2016376 RepID=A0ABV7GKB4_9GAMM|nr:hypothetical protein [Shewanella submarina]MCL1037927.1 hypothetical protein [Shewanella submarina]
MAKTAIITLSIAVPCFALILVELVSLFQWQGNISLFAIEATRTVSLTILFIVAIDLLLMAFNKKRRDISQQ